MTYEDIQKLLYNEDNTVNNDRTTTGQWNTLQRLQTQNQNSRGTGAAIAGYPQDPRQAAAALASSPSGTAEQWPMYQDESARQTAFNLGQDRRGTYTTPGKELEYVSGKLRGMDQPHMLDDPDLKMLMGRDPKKAKYVYSSLTGGRDYDNDLQTREAHAYARSEKLDNRAYEEGQNAAVSRAKSFSDAQKAAAEYDMAPVKAARDFVFKQIQRGIKVNPDTGKIMLWQDTEPEAGGIGGDQRPVRKMVEATPEQELLIKKHYNEFTGMDLPQAHPLSPAQIGRESMFQEGMTPEIRSHYEREVENFTKKVGFAPNQAERMKIMNDAYGAYNPDTDVSPMAGEVTHSFNKAFLGVKQDISPEEFAARLGTEGVPLPDNRLNWWGRLMRSMPGPSARAIPGLPQSAGSMRPFTPGY